MAKEGKLNHSLSSVAKVNSAWRFTSTPISVFVIFFSGGEGRFDEIGKIARKPTKN
jgi:hypothetical protein